ncbi:type II toxin-antitoxin system RelE/ParE family toxin [uncultured Sphingomonas sp.]|uniref:type II toxin-antitoxin system RelE/ParE family toxin n=1 Tax=uncultured Sphingomonas sp. TaxID=158754 RepID=UPI002598B6C5|nr:type II toxin-antitoxin system RelE/ParE family toxin [uncultured Sphingomonas sp.]
MSIFYRLSGEAEEDFIAIYRYGFENYGQDQAERYAQRLRQCFLFLANHPRAARLRVELTPPVRAHPMGAHLIVYDVDEEDAITILRISHSRSDWATD